MDSKMEINSTPLICRVCGDVARGVNFDVISCMSCKAFFRRHALDKSKTLRCYLDGHCEISQQTRKCCSACRLQKCFTLGMNPQLIRRVSQSQTIQISHRSITKTLKHPQLNLPQPTPIDLLRNDRSTLTSEEWNLLSNTIHAYDDESVLDRTNHIYKEQSCLPPKIRFKGPATLDVIGSFYSAVKPFIERCPYFHVLPLDARRLLIQHNLSGLGGLNTAFIVRETNLIIDPGYVSACNNIYGPELIHSVNDLINRLDQNGTLIKIMLIILAFSSNCSFISYDYSKDPMTNTKNEMILMHIQNMFVTMMWKYLEYQYGFQGAVHRFDLLMRTFLQILKQTENNSSREHWGMVDGIVDQTERLLTVNS